MWTPTTTVSVTTGRKGRLVDRDMVPAWVSALVTASDAAWDAGPETVPAWARDTAPETVPGMAAACAPDKDRNDKLTTP